MENKKFRIGTRGSPLALKQTGMAIKALKEANPHIGGKGAFEMVVIKTTADRIQNASLALLGGKGLFTKELDEAMLNHQIDIAIHSMKDIPNTLPQGILLHAVMPREDVRDAFISNKSENLINLPPESTIGTSSLRRKSQLLNIRPDLKVTPIRGNIDTRLDKIKNGIIDATLLAHAGLIRLGKESVITELIDAEVLVPAVGQGSLAATCREDDVQANSVLATLCEPATTAAIIAERAMLTVLGGSCHAPTGGLAQPDGQGNLRLRGLIASSDGKEKVDLVMSAPITEAETLGKTMAEDLLAKGGKEILQSISKLQPAFIPKHPEAD